ncbi:type II toxin-antitoxin system HicA family toxin [Candidatus Poribacteria bacterium]|nr:type II toxin-antitoxin system HicA family toxin [Candidatus Poribacteria bacterium]MYC77886.1 type II toxin-antitoxin system HicA family toxin [Candidatus Poribacteria bacterium]
MNIRLNKKHRRTLEAIFSKEVPATLQWRRIEALFKALGALKDEKSGSSVTFELNRKTTTLHRPHPRKEINRYQVRDIRDFLKRAGITL